MVRPLLVVKNLYRLLSFVKLEGWYLSFDVYLGFLFRHILVAQGVPLVNIQMEKLLVYTNMTCLV